MARYDHRYNARFRTGEPFSPWYPGAFWGAPMAGWMGWPGIGGGGWHPYSSFGYEPYGRNHPRRQRPRESPTYGRGGDLAARRYARDRGYDAGYAIAPHPRHEPWPAGRYDRGFRGGR